MKLRHTPVESFKKKRRRKKVVVVVEEEEEEEVEEEKQQKQVSKEKDTVDANMKQKEK
jgi:hypothetical protein